MSLNCPPSSGLIVFYLRGFTYVSAFEYNPIRQYLYICFEERQRHLAQRSLDFLLMSQCLSRLMKYQHYNTVTLYRSLFQP